MILTHLIHYRLITNNDLRSWWWRSTQISVIPQISQKYHEIPLLELPKQQTMAERCINNSYWCCFCIRDGVMGEASKVFLMRDVCGRRYLCYLVSCRRQLRCVKFEESNDRSQLIFGSINYLHGTRDAIPLTVSSLLSFYIKNLWKNALLNPLFKTSEWRFDLFLKPADKKRNKCTWPLVNKLSNRAGY